MPMLAVNEQAWQFKRRSPKPRVLDARPVQILSTEPSHQHPACKEKRGAATKGYHSPCYGPSQADPTPDFESAAQPLAARPCWLRFFSWRHGQLATRSDDTAGWASHVHRRVVGTLADRGIPTMVFDDEALDRHQTGGTLARRIDYVDNLAVERLDPCAIDIYAGIISNSCLLLKGGFWQSIEGKKLLVGGLERQA